MNPIPTQIYTIPTPNPIPLHMIPNPESNSDSDSSFDSDSGFGIAPGLVRRHANLIEYFFAKLKKMLSAAYNKLFNGWPGGLLI